MKGKLGQIVFVLVVVILLSIQAIGCNADKQYHKEDEVTAYIAQHLRYYLYEEDIPFYNHVKYFGQIRGVYFGQIWLRKHSDFPVHSIGVQYLGKGEWSFNARTTVLELNMKYVDSTPTQWLWRDTTTTYTIWVYGKFYERDYSTEITKLTKSNKQTNEGVFGLPK